MTNGWNPGMLDGVNNFVMIVIQYGRWMKLTVEGRADGMRRNESRDLLL